MTKFDPALDAAFRATTYRVETPVGDFDLRIGGTNLGFSSWLKEQEASRWGLVTASNPGGKRLSFSENAARDAALRARIIEHKWQYFPASNHADSGGWPVETGYCILDADKEDLRILAAAFGQAAIVVGQGKDGDVRLVWV